MFTEPSVDLEERVQFLSEGWRSESERFFGEVTTAELPETPHIVTHKFVNVPLHVGHDDSYSYSLSLGRSGIEYSTGTHERSDETLEVDYNTYLPSAYWVPEMDPAERQKSLRELSFLQGSCRESKNTLCPQSVDSILLDWQRHMGVRTLNNPDIEHRIDGLGLRSHVDELDDKGYTVVHDAFTNDFADELREEARRNHSLLGPNEGFRAAMLLKRGRMWELAAIHPWVITFAEYLLGRGCLLYQSDTIIKYAGLDTHPGLHSDYGASRIPEPFPEYCVEATAVWALDDFTREAGPTVFLPKSHRKKTQVPRGTTRDGTILLEMPKGSIAFWHGASWHGSMARTAKGTRTSLHNAYCRQFMRPIEKYDDIDREIVNRNPPMFATLCGLDDPLGKNRFNGPDFRRMNYATANGYGSSTFSRPPS